MTISITKEQIPLKVDEDGVVRIGNTRVTLDTVVAAFKEGETAEEICQQYPSLDLADIYAIIGYYLRQRSEVETYLHHREIQTEEVQKENENRFGSQGLRERLLARRNRKAR